MVNKLHPCWGYEEEWLEARDILGGYCSNKGDR